MGKMMSDIVIYEDGTVALNAQVENETILFSFITTETIVMK